MKKKESELKAYKLLLASIFIGAVLWAVTIDLFELGKLGRIASLIVLFLLIQFVVKPIARRFFSRQEDE